MGKGRKQKSAPLSKLEKLYHRDGGCCWICGLRGEVADFNRDHLIPRSLGGSDGMWNLRISHPICNTIRGTKPPPLSVVLMYCTKQDMAQRAKRMYYRAYPYLKKSAPSSSATKAEDAQAIVKPRVPTASGTPGPIGHKSYPSMVCSMCIAWCHTCMVCWCMAYENDHDVFKIRRYKVAMGISPSS